MMGAPRHGLVEKVLWNPWTASVSHDSLKHAGKAGYFCGIMLGRISRVFLEKSRWILNQAARVSHILCGSSEICHTDLGFSSRYLPLNVCSFPIVHSTANFIVQKYLKSLIFTT